ncbi:MAG: rhodanese-like domain-containing protein [Treponema sp.]|nr:rhodanese-like domain-containing protein [Treponema sp.]
MRNLIIFSFVCICMLPGCKSTDTYAARGYHSITAPEAYNMIRGLDDYIILDVRSVSEHQKKRIPGAVSIPFLQVKNRAEAELPDKDAMIFVHCLSGGRSTKAARELVKLGYKNVYDFKKLTKWPGELERD